MTDTDQTLDKRLVICPLSFALGYIQNYRVTERPNKGALESRPVKGTDAFADDFFKVLHAPAGEPVEVTHSSGRTIQLRGLGQGDGMTTSGKAAQALKFPMKAGLKAREQAILAVNEGKARAPKKNWDSTYGPEKTITYRDPKTGEETTYQIGGGKSVDDLKSEYPDMYGQKARKRQDDDEGMIDDDTLNALNADEDEPETRGTSKVQAVSEPITGEEEDDLEAMADEIEGEGAFSEDEVEEESYAAIEVAEPPADVVEDFDFEDNTEPGESASQASQEGRLSGAAAARHEQKEKTGSGRIEKFDEPRTKSSGHLMSVDIKAPKSATAVKTQAIKYMSRDQEVTAFAISCQNCGEKNWMVEGKNHCHNCGEPTDLNVQS